MPDLKTSVSSHVHYRKMGSGPAMVLLHGFPESSNLWRNVQDQLSRSFTLIMPDFPGFGESILEQETGINDLAHMLKELLDHEQMTKAVVAGHSMGGYAALAFATHYPDMVAGLSLVHSTPAPDDEEKKQNRLKSAGLIRNGGRELFVKQMIPNLFADAFKQNNTLIVKEQTDEALKVSGDSLANYTDAMRLRADTRDGLRHAGYPVQWIIGKGDNLMHYKNLLAECHHSAINFVSFYQQSGHMSMMEEPLRLAGDLETFGLYSHKLN